jgi:arginyl-tRNA synthetase
MNLFTNFRTAVLAAVSELAAAGVLPKDAATDAITVEPPRDPAHGDVATNAALVLAKAAGKPPRVVGQHLAAVLAKHPDVATAEVAGPGFVNLRLADGYWQERLKDTLRAAVAYGDSRIGQGIKVNVEYVSANPTGPLHVGHCRGAVYGDALANLLVKAGFAVTREYYVNDAGAQVGALARSVFYRYRQALGETVEPMAADLYPGDYLVPVGASLADRAGRRLLDLPESEAIAECADFGRDAMMALIRNDLAALGIRHDVFTSERELHGGGEVQAAFAVLQGKGLIYRGVLEPPKGMKLEDWEPREQDLFRASQFGDDIDRPLKKSDGSWTYFAADMAYHYDKYQRGFAQMIDVWGADHAGYVKRVNAAVKALTDGRGALDVKICQLVNLMDGGEPVKMSKRAGSFVTARDVVDRVGRDVVRFIMLTRKNDAPLEFDFQKVTEQSKDNPVFYVQYAHARTRSVLRNAAEIFGDANLSPAALAEGALARLSHPAEVALIKLIAAWPRVVETAAEAHEPHRVAFYLHELAGAFHALWNLGTGAPELRFIVNDDRPLALARLALVAAVGIAVASGLRVMGVEPLEEMR